MDIEYIPAILSGLSGAAFIGYVGLSILSHYESVRHARKMREIEVDSYKREKKSHNRIIKMFSECNKELESLTRKIRDQTNSLNVLINT